MIEDHKKENEIQELPKFDFMKEQIKERPLNKKKLLRRTALTAAMAVLFGLVACLTVLVLEPVFSNWLYPEEPAENITFPPDTEEILPEDMVLDDEELAQENEEETEETQNVAAGTQIDELDIYRGVYKCLQELTGEVSKCLVTVTGVTSDTDWFDNPYESKGQTTGIIAANNSKEYFVLADMQSVKAVETISITFCNGANAQAEVKMNDPITGLSILSIDKKEIESETLDRIETAVFGSSNYASLTGSPVIALGSPTGVSGSVVYGTVTSSGNVLHTADSRYKLITTDIYGSSRSTGVLVNLQGQIVGIVNQNYRDDEMENMIVALGISELKETIERLSNGKSQPYMGIYGTDVTDEIHQKLKVPYGAYVTEIEMDSPAMQAGIQSGDVIVSLSGRMISNYAEYIEALSDCTPISTVNVTLMRKNQEEYKAMSFQLTLGELK